MEKYNTRKKATGKASYAKRRGRSGNRVRRLNQLRWGDRHTSCAERGADTGEDTGALVDSHPSVADGVSSLNNRVHVLNLFSFFVILLEK